MSNRPTSKVYARLYHYTTWQGALGILRTNHLWATHYKFLNDYSEIVQFRDRLIAFLGPHVLEEYSKLVSTSPEAGQKIAASGGLDEVVRHDTSTIVDIFYRTAADEIYVASFCGEHREDEYINANGLLSQWRGYGGDGGIALVFRTSELEKLLEKEAEIFDYNGGHFADVVYSDNEQKFAEELQGKLPAIANYMKQLFQSMRLAALIHEREDF